MTALAETPNLSFGGDSMTGFDRLVEPGTVPPLRRAVYHKVADFALNYKINLQKLQEENEKIRKNSCDNSKEESSDSNGSSTNEDEDGKAKQDNNTDADDLSHVQDKESSSSLTVPVSPSSIITNEEKRSFSHKGFLQKIIPPNCGFNLCLLVGKVEVVVDKFRVDHSRVRLAEVELGDETATVSLRARDNQIDLLKDISGRSGSVVLRNCTLELYQGKHLRLAVTKWGKLTEYPDCVPSTPPAPKTMNRELNFSKVDLHLVLDFDMESEQKIAHEPSSVSQSTNNIQNAPTNHMSQQMVGGQVHQRKYREKKKNRKGPYSNGRNQNRPAYRDNNINIPINMSSLPPLTPYTHIYAGSGPQFAYHGQSQQPSDLQEQQLLLLQQYELQQRHMEQIQLYRHQQERHVPTYIAQGHTHQLSQASSAGAPPDLRSVDSTDFSVASLGSEFILTRPGATSHQLDNAPHGVSVAQRIPARQHFLGNSQGIVTSGSGDLQNYNPIQSHSSQIPHQGFENLVTVNSAVHGSESPSIFVTKMNEQQYVTHPDHKQNVESWNTKQHISNKTSSVSGMMKGSMSPQMNPQASSFAPSYGQMMMYPAHQQLHPMTLQYMGPTYAPASDATSPQPMQMYGSMLPNQTLQTTEGEENAFHASNLNQDEGDVIEGTSPEQEKAKPTS